MWGKRVSPDQRTPVREDRVSAIPSERAWDERGEDVVMENDRWARTGYHRNRRERPGDRMSCLALVSFSFIRGRERERENLGVMVR